MSATENDSLPSAEIIKGGVELIKVAYGDIARPGAKEVGKSIETIAKTINVALSPLRGLVWGWDKIQVYLEEKIQDILNRKNVPIERIVTPSPDIAVPTIEAMRYSNLRDNYANLLATAMDSASMELAHPSFVEILKQISPNEAKILLKISKSYDKDGRFMWEPIINGSIRPGQNINCPPWESICQSAGVFDLKFIGIYYTNLLRLGIITEALNGRTAIPNFGNVSLGDDDDPWAIDEDFGEINLRYLSLTNFGVQFIEACVIEQDECI